MAGPPTSRPSPGRVTVPTPGPPARWMPGLATHTTRAWMCAPCVTSGSSPASLTTLQLVHRSPCCHSPGAKVAVPPMGRWIVTSAGRVPVSKATVAARAAAAAHDPVVKPVRRPRRLRGGGARVSSSLTSPPSRLPNKAAPRHAVVHQPLDDAPLTQVLVHDLRDVVDRDM